MTPKQTAVTRVAFMLASWMLVAVLMVNLLNYFSITQIAIGFCVCLLAYGIKVLYNIELDKAETLDRLNKFL